MTYHVKEIYSTVQGEGFHTGRSAVFLRFAGCNLWSGQEVDRARAVCRFCDTDFVGIDGPGGGRFAGPAELAAAVRRHWQGGPEDPFVVLTGGEPTLQVDAPLIDALHEQGFTIAIETNGTLSTPLGIDWICVSPKAGAPLVQRCGDELKLVFPQEGADPAEFEAFDFTHFFLQPMDGPQVERHTRDTLAYCRAHPRWLPSIQLHKYLGIP